MTGFSRRKSRDARASMRRTGAALFLAALVSALAAPAAAQAPSAHSGTGAAATVPPLPSGNGRIVIEVVGRADGSARPGVDLALYALSPDGAPGLASGVTGADGAFTFEGVSTAEGITYLAGAQYEGIPFGQRVAFEPGASEQRIRIEVDEASLDGPPIQVGESRVQLGWLGRHLLFDVTHLLQNTGETVRNVPKDAREGATPLFETALPVEFVEFAEAAVGFADGLDRDGTRLRFFGPLYPGQQEVRYRFTLAVPETDAGETEFSVSWPQPMGSGRLTVLTPTSGPTLLNASPISATPLELEGVAYDSTVLAPVDAGQTLALELAVPPSRTAPDAVQLDRADYWIDHDDASVTVRVQLQLKVAPGPHVQAGADAPLLHIDLPEGAEIHGIATDAQRVGLEASPQGGLDLVGPVPAGDSSIEFGYGLPAGEDATTSIDLRVDRDVPVINVLVADNGVAVESSRLHRRRPFRQGTRNYLHRRAFQVAAGETVDVRLSPLGDRTSRRSTSLAAMALLGGGAVWLMIAPMRAQRRTEDTAEVGQTREREMIYQAIRDLDHDLETGKIDAADHAELRGQLRSEAIEIVRRERAGDTAAQQEDATVSAAPASHPASPAAEARFCTQCGGRIDGSWRFCSHCGAEIPAA